MASRIYHLAAKHVIEGQINKIGFICEKDRELFIKQMKSYIDFCKISVTINYDNLILINGTSPSWIIIDEVGEINKEQLDIIKNLNH